MNTIDVNPYQFLRHWLASAIGVWLASTAASLIVWTPIAILSSILGQYDNLVSLSRVLTAIAIFTIPGICIGYVLGEMQHQLIQRFLHWEFNPYWVRYSTIGGLLGGMIVILAVFLFKPYVSERIQWMISLPLFILPVSIMQWRVLKQVARDAWMWVLGNLVGAIVFSGLFFPSQPMPFNSSEPIASLLTWFFAAASLGMITGIVMLWLYDRPASNRVDDDAELAPVYIEVRNQDKR